MDVGRVSFPFHVHGVYIGGRVALEKRVVWVDAFVRVLGGNRIAPELPYSSGQSKWPTERQLPGGAVRMPQHLEIVLNNKSEYAYWESSRALRCRDQSHRDMGGWRRLAEIG